MSYLFTSESVSEGHPDKLCDQISDALVDAFLSQDPESKVACETLTTTGLVVCAGEVKTEGYVSVDEVVRDVIRRVGYDKSDYQFDHKSCGVISTIHSQSKDINRGVERSDPENQGAGDQGIMFGYACNEMDNYMPLPIELAHRFVQELAEIRKEKKEMTYLRPDSKSQVTVQYSDDNIPERIDTIVVSTQHDEFADDDTMLSVIERDIREILIPRVISTCPENVKPLFKDYKLLVNPTGKFVIGGPHGDTGLTGRKIIVDTYGGYGAHGGGAFCVDGDTEYLTKDGWKKISGYKNGEVAQWNNGKLEFVKPYAYYKVPHDKMYRIHKANYLDMVVSQNHNIVLRTSKGNIIKKRALDLLSGDNSVRNGNNGYIPCSFEYDGGNGISLTDDEIRLQVAVCADGSFQNKNKTCRVRVKKSYKKENMEKFLNLTNTEYKTMKDDDYLIYVFTPPVMSKSLTECFRNANKHQIGIIADELPNWDGNRKNTFRTTHKDDADFAQFVFMSAYGNASSILSDDRVGETYENNGKTYERKSVLYAVTALKYKDTSFRKSDNPKSKTKIYVEDYIPEDGNMYCFAVPSTMLVLRRNNIVFVTGNSGKDPSKVDRSAAYAARHIAKNMVAAGLCDKVIVQVAYAIGKADPVGLYVNTYGTSKVDMTDGEIAVKIGEIFPMRPYHIINRFKLKNPIYEPTASYGHFGREPYTETINGKTVEFFTWEKLDYVDKIKDAFNI